MPLILPFFLVACGVILILIHVLPRKLYFPCLLFSVAIVLAATYYAYPAQRIVSNHGLFHSAVIYQMLGGSIPPDNPFLAGTTLHYPWVYDLLVAGLMKCLPITPSIAFAALNVAAWMAVCVVVHAVSRRLIRDTASNATSTAMALLANTAIGTRFNGWLREHDINLVEPRGVPAITKFSNINAYPLGFVLFFVMILSLINIASNRHRTLNQVLFAICFLATGFVYPLLIFNCLTSVGLIAAAALFCHFRKIDFIAPKQVLIIGGSAAACCLILKPFYDSVGTGMTFTSFFFQTLSYETVARKCLSFLAHTLLLLLLIVAYRRHLLASLDRRTLLLIACVIAASALDFFTFHIYSTGEYKFLITTMALLGLLGGLAAKPFARSRWRPLAWLILPVLLFVPFDNLREKCAKPDPRFLEAGSGYRVTEDPEEDELYRWIRESTDTESVWVDIKSHIPVLAQRRLLFAHNFRGTQGYGFRLYEHLITDKTLAETRMAISRRLYESNVPLDADQWEHLKALGVDVYLLARSPGRALRMERVDHARAFATQTGRFSVFHIVKRSP